MGKYWENPIQAGEMPPRVGIWRSLGCVFGGFSHVRGLREDFRVFAMHVGNILAFVATDVIQWGTRMLRPIRMVQYNSHR